MQDGSRSRLLLVSISALALVWAGTAVTFAGATDAAALLLELVATAVLATTAVLTREGRARRVVGLFAGWALLTTVGDSWWLSTSGSPAVAYAQGEYEPAGTVVAYLLRYPLAAMAVALSVSSSLGRPRGRAALGHALALVQVTACTAALLTLATPLGDLIADRRSYSVFFAVDVLLVAGAVGTVLRFGVSRALALTAGTVVALAAADAFMVWALLTGSTAAGVAAYTVFFGASILAVGLHRRTGDVPVGPSALPPASPARGWTRPVRRTVTRVLLPLVVLVLATGRFAERDGLPALQVGLVAVALALALLDAVVQVVRAEEDERAAAGVLRDELTGAWSRRGLFQHLAGRGAATPSTVLLLDLDGFKGVNDRYGHAAGDEVLRATVSRVAQVVDGRGLVARLGGDEFVVLLDGPAGDLAGRLAAAISEPLPLPGGTSVRVSASIGAVTPDGFGDGDGDGGREGHWDTVLAEADRRMYAQKRRHPPSVRPTSPGVGSPRAW